MKKEKSETRVLSEKIQKLTRQSLIMVNSQANELVNLGIAKSTVDALEYILDLEMESEDEQMQRSLVETYGDGE